MSNGIPVKIIPDNCRGCRRCEIACSWHGRGPLNPRLAGIKIMKLDQGATDYPVLDMECLEHFCGKVDTAREREFEPACVSACLFGALKILWEENDHE
jgi:Fe-S-cluster-containing dehydrogenase component